MSDEKFFNDKGRHIVVTESFRTRERQQELYNRLSKTGGRVAPPGKSFHEKGLAVDVKNWQEAAPYLKQHGIVNGLKGDMMHFSMGEMENWCYKKDVGEDQQQYVRMAAEISNNDPDFLCMLEGENGLWNMFRQSDYVNEYGVREDSWGFCQLNRIWHSDTVDDERFFTDARWQMEQCYEHYTGGTIFYGANSCPRTRERFICPQS
jgi:hypothetical protein